MRRFITLLFVGVAAVISLGPALGQSSAPAPPPSGSPTEGRKTYLQLGCWECHGTVGQGAAERFGPKIAPKPLPYFIFAQQLRSPRNPIQSYTPMPVYTSKILSDQQAADIYAYLLSIPDAKKLNQIDVLNDLRTSSDE